MILLSLEEFTSRRRKAQTDLEDLIRPEVERAVRRDIATHGWRDLLDTVKEAYGIAYSEESGERDAPPPPEKWLEKIEAALKKVTRRDEVGVDRLTIWLATSILSAATIQASQADEEDLFLEWVTMGDTNVRPSHRSASGQVRPIGEKFNVDGVPMEYPGDSSAPPDEWINCRCTLRPTLADEFHTKTANLGQTGATTEGVAMADEVENTETPMADVLVPFYSVLAPEGKMSGDKRRFAPGSLRNRPLPLPLTWQKISAEGHGGNVVVAKVTSIGKVDGEQRAVGYFLDIPEADEVLGLIAEFGKFGISVDADDATFEYNEDEDCLDFTDARTASACIVPIPAFHEAYISMGLAPEGFMPDDAETLMEESSMGDAEEVLVASLAPEAELADLAPGKTEDGPGWLTHPVDTDRLRDYWTKGPGAAKIGWGTPGDFNRCRVNVAEYVKPQHLNGYCANRHYDALGYWPGEHNRVTTESFTSEEQYSFSLDTAEVLNFRTLDVPKAPSAWFKNPELTELTHLTVTEEGQVYGHVAGWNICHGLFQDKCVLPPHSETEYAYFATGETLTDEGPVRTGPLTVGGPHAGGRLRLRPAQAHYDNTTVAVADVCVGEDQFGIWVAGWVRPGATPEQVIALRASDISGDWRKVGFSMELIAVLAVNVPGFAVTRVAASMINGEQMSLVSAGVVPKPTGKAKVEFSDEAIHALVESLAEEMEQRNERKRRMAALAAKYTEGDQ